MLRINKKKTSLIILILFTLSIPMALFAYSGHDDIYQISTYDSLSKGGYEGFIPLEDMLDKGDFGIGTFQGIDGEMLVLDGVIYQIKHDGSVVIKKNKNLKKELTPYAVVKNFNKDISSKLKSADTYASLQEQINALITDKNKFYAIKVEGTFNTIKTRSVPAQTKPFPPLTDVVAKQNTFDLTNVKGTLVGFWCPQYVGGVNVAGFHLHFLTTDKTKGGHVLELNLASGTAKLDKTNKFNLELDPN